VLAFSPIVNGHCEVLFADGSVDRVSEQRFAELSQRGLVQLATPQEMAADQQRVAITKSEFEAAPAEPNAMGLATPNTVSGSTPTVTEPPLALSPMPGSISGLLASPPVTVAPAVAGIRSIRIELPQTGQPFLFTKVLNIGDVPLSIRARIMPMRTFQAIQMTWQTAAFLFGLAVWWWQWRRGQKRSTFILTVALALVLGSVCSLLVEWRALHDALIIGFPVVTLAIISLLVWKYWPRGNKPEIIVNSPPPTSPGPETGIPPVAPIAAGIVLLLALGLANATAANSDTSNASIVSANYSGTVNDRVAIVDATLQFSSLQSGQIVPLYDDDVAVQQFSAKNGSAELIRDGNKLAVKFGNRGDATLQIKMLVKLGGDVTKRWLKLDIPPALSSQMSFVIDQPDADVDFQNVVSFKRTTSGQQTRVDAIVGPAEWTTVQWTPRVKRAEEVAATVFCQNASLATFGGGVMNVRATLDYQITQGELRQARVQLPTGQRLLRIEGQDIRTWEIKDENGAQILVVDLLNGVSPSWQLTVETEKVLNSLPASEPVAVPHALDVKRETGLVALRGAEELGLSVESASGLQRVDREEFARMVAGEADSLLSVFQFSKPQFSLLVRAEAIQPEIEAVVRNNFQVGTGRVSLSSGIDYTIKRAGIFSLEIALPDGYLLENVTGDGIQQQTELGEGNTRVLQITLKDRTSGAYTVALKLTRNFKELPRSLAIAGVYPLGASKLTGYVAVSAEPGVAVRTETFDGMTEIPAVSLPDYATVAGAGSVLAYKFISPDPKSTAEWNLSVATETVAAWMRAEIVDTFTINETLVSGRAVVRYDIANAPMKVLRVKVPSEFQNVEFTGQNIRSQQQDGNIWSVELQSPIHGIYTLSVTWDMPRSSRTNTLELTGVSAEGVERETGLLAISAKAPLQVGEIAATDLQRVDTSDFPGWAGNPDNATALAYSYVRPDYKLALEVRRFDEAEVLQALVDSVQFTSVVADDGQMMTETSLSLKNNGRQYLEVQLPPGASVWSAFVAGQAVQPGQRDGKILLPVQSSGADDGTTAVELTYVSTNVFPRVRGDIGLASPIFDVPVKNARWEIYLPPDYDYRNFAGSMTRETVQAIETATSSFSILDYSRMEQVNKETAKIEVERNVSEAKRQLALGDVRGANESVDRAKAQGYRGKDDFIDIEELETNLQNAAASNLVLAQSDFTLRNSGISGGAGEIAGQSTPSLFQPDDTAAGEQWSKLQQAQEITTVTVQPLHINLPVRGQHFAFTQVLQTETGRPMTIQLFAANTKAVNWPARLLAGTVSFLIFWCLVAFLSHINLRAKRA
jgi:hypothetical protein